MSGLPALTAVRAGSKIQGFNPAYTGQGFKAKNYEKNYIQVQQDFCLINPLPADVPLIYVFIYLGSSRLQFLRSSL